MAAKDRVKNLTNIYTHLYRQRDVCVMKEIEIKSGEEEEAVITLVSSYYMNKNNVEKEME